MLLEITDQIFVLKCTPPRYLYGSLHASLFFNGTLSDKLFVNTLFRLVPLQFLSPSHVLFFVVILISTDIICALLLVDDDVVCLLIINFSHKNVNL